MATPPHQPNTRDKIHAFVLVLIAFTLLQVLFYFAFDVVGHGNAAIALVFVIVLVAWIVSRFIPRTLAWSLGFWLITNAMQFVSPASEIWRFQPGLLVTPGSVAVLAAFVVSWLHASTFIGEYRYSAQGLDSSSTNVYGPTRGAQVRLVSVSLFLSALSSGLFFVLLELMGWFLVYGDNGPSSWFFPMRVIATGVFFLFISWYLYKLLLYFRYRNYVRRRKQAF